MSSSGRWYKGQTFTPPKGSCSEHVVEVLNPSVMAEQSITKTTGSGSITRTGDAECVMARCTVCLYSMMFPEVATVPGPGVADEEYADVAMKVFNLLGESADE